MMPHPLELKLARLRRSARQYILSKAFARALVSVLLTGLLLAGIDAMFHYQDRGLRAISSLVLLTVLAVAMRRFWRAVYESRLSDVQIAQRLERFYPPLRGRLASAVELRANRPRIRWQDPPRSAGRSFAMPRSPLTSSTCRPALDARPARRALFAMGVSLAVVACFFAFGGSSAWTAAQRLLNPLSDVEWPRMNQLAIVAPVLRLPHGQTFEVEVVDQASATPPDDVVMHYRFRSPDGEVTEETEPLKALGGQLLARREGVERPFEYRAVGGDDYAMRWQQLEVVEPPTVRSTALELHFPSYTGWPERASEANMRALVGTHVAVQVTFTKSLSEAAVALGSESSIPATVRPDGLAATIDTDAEPAFVIRASGPYWFALTDREGFHNSTPTKYEIRAIPDAPPTADIEQPRANLFVTPDAVLSLKVRAGDDLAVRNVTLEYLRSDKSDAGAESLMLSHGPDTAPAELAAASAAEGYTGDRRDLSYEWQLTPLEFPPGTQVTFHAAAVDYAGKPGRACRGA